MFHIILYVYINNRNYTKREKKILEFFLQFLLIVVLGLLTVEDLLSQKFSQEFLLLIIFLWLIDPAKSFLNLFNVIAVGGILIGARYFIQRKYPQPKIGSGDIKLMSLLSLWIEWGDIASYFLWIGVFGIIFGFLWTRGAVGLSFPLAPAISLGFLATKFSPFFPG